MGAWGIPAINTLLLLLVGRHGDDRALRAQGEQPPTAEPVPVLHDRARRAVPRLQVYEYSHAYSELNLKLTTGAYGSTFFMLTGFQRLFTSPAARSCCR
jgi:cytochrome c oxidase subunit 3